MTQDTTEKTQRRNTTR